MAHQSTSTPSAAPDRQSPGTETLYEEYPLNVRIIEGQSGAETTYRFEAPEHVHTSFTDPEMATLYADIYFAVNGFVEEETGERGIPPEIVGAGKHVLAAYMVTQMSVDWVCSFIGTEAERVQRFVTWTREQGAEVREAAAEESDHED
jgi:hypothetical protein